MSEHDTDTTTYTCPMHTDVRENEPGECPSCGMSLEPAASGETPDAGGDEDRELRDMTRRLVGGLLFGVPVMVLAMGGMIPGLRLARWIGHDLSTRLQLALCTPVVLWAGWPLLRRGVRSVMRMKATMFTLVSLGISAAYLYSAVAALAPGFFPASFRVDGRVAVYFEAAAMITVLVLLGQVIELRARKRTGGAVRELMQLAPDTARVLRDGEETVVPVEEIQPGDRIRVKPGDRVPVDGTIREGGSSLDESMITGESMPVEKGAGDPVTGGTGNRSGSFVMEAEQVGRDTVLSRIVDLVTRAQRSRAPVQRLVDVVASWFVPAVIGTAVLTFIVWATAGPSPRFTYALVNAVAVLIAACPCALGLATPMAVMVGVGRGATEGILIKDAEVLEIMEKVDTLVVDKTGTLTEGRPALGEIRPAGDVSADDLLAAAASLESASEHPIADALVRGARDRGLSLSDPRDFSATAGAGVRGAVGGRLVVVGKPAYLEREGVDIDGDTAAAAASLQEEGHTVVFAAIDGACSGALSVVDPVKEGTPEAIAGLHAMGIAIVMLTGDNEKTAAGVADTLGIDEFSAGMSPREKHDWIASRSRETGITAMAGDGINDAPALAAADVGIAMGGGADVAVESAGVTLMQGDLRRIARALRLSGRVMRNIRQNLVFAFGYNTVAVPVAAGVLYPFFGLLLNPIIAAAAMSMSSVSVIGNALRLRRSALE